MDGTKKLSLRFPGSLPFAFGMFAVASLMSCGNGGGPNPSSFAVTEDPGTDMSLDSANDLSRPVGFYTNGSLTNAVKLPNESVSFVKIFRLRDRAYGTRTLIATIVNGANAFRRLFPTGDRLQVGDIGKEFGGSASGHESHQNGLDADFGYLQSNAAERNPDSSGPNGFAEVFVSGDRVTPNFDTTRNWFLLKSLVLRGNVGRIFVDPVIKNTFCSFAKTLDPSESSAVRAEILRRLRPYPNHGDHFHMRVNCPANAARCIPQEEPPAGSGCFTRTNVSEAEHSMTGGDDSFGE